MQFEIPFEEKNSRKDSELIFDLYWKEHLKKNKKTIYYFIYIIGRIDYIWK